MTQVFIIDCEGFYTGETKCVEEPSELEIVIPCNTCEEDTFYKPKWDEGKWIEGATQKEIDEANKIEICPEPTDKERITKLEEEKAILAENVYQLASILEVMLGGTESGQTTTTTTDTIN